MFTIVSRLIAMKGDGQDAFERFILIPIPMDVWKVWKVCLDPRHSAQQAALKTGVVSLRQGTLLPSGPNRTTQN